MESKDNHSKHGLPFEVAVRVFEGPYLQQPEPALGNPLSYFRVIGEVSGRVIILAYLKRMNVKEILSARRATDDEKALYYQRASVAPHA